MSTLHHNSSGSGLPHYHDVTFSRMFDGGHLEKGEGRGKTWYLIRLRKIISSLMQSQGVRFTWFDYKLVGVSSKHRRVFLESLQQSSTIFGHLKFSEILGKCSETFVWPSEQFWTIFGNLWKISKRHHQYVYTIKRTLHVSSKIRILCSRGKNNISLVRCAQS